MILQTMVNNTKVMNSEWTERRGGYSIECTTVLYCITVGKTRVKYYHHYHYYYYHCYYYYYYYYYGSY